MFSVSVFQLVVMVVVAVVDVRFKCTTHAVFRKLKDFEIFFYCYQSKYIFLLNLSLCLNMAHSLAVCALWVKWSMYDKIPER